MCLLLSAAPLIDASQVKLWSKFLLYETIANMSIKMMPLFMIISYSTYHSENL